MATTVRYLRHILRYILRHRWYLSLMFIWFLIKVFIVLTLKWLLPSPWFLFHTVHNFSVDTGVNLIIKSEASNMIKSRIESITAQSYDMQASQQKFYSCPNRNFELLAQSVSVRQNNHYWQNPADTGLFIYSAFYDDRLYSTLTKGHKYIHLIAMLDSVFNMQSEYYCQFWLKNSTVQAISSAVISDIWFPDWDNDVRHHSYTPCVLSCIIPDSIIHTFKFDLHVSVSTLPCQFAKTNLPVRHYSRSLMKNVTDVRRFVVCVKPMDFSEDFSQTLMEWIELNVLLGIDLLHFYTFRVHPNVSRILYYYERLKIVKVTPTTLPGNQPNNPYERSAFHRRNLWQKRRNELISYNDCFYEHLYSHKYVIPLDIDELIMPKQHKTLPELFNYLSESYSTLMNGFASFAVKNVYFLESFGIHRDIPHNVNQSSYFLKHVYRSANFTTGSKAVKSFIRTDAAYKVFNHYAMESIAPGVGRSADLPWSLVQMNHYRSQCPSTMSSECQDNFLKFVVVDKLLWRYKEALMSKLEKVRQEVFTELH